WLLVERPEILDRAAAAADDDDIAEAGTIQTRERACHIGRRTLSLDARRRQHHAGPGRTLLHDMQDVMQCGARSRRDDTDARGMRRQRSLALRSEQAFSLQATAKLLEREPPESIAAARFEFAHAELEITAPLVQRE